MPINFDTMLPAYTPVQLPSKGLLYSAPSPLANGGWVHIREYCATEEALYNTMNTENGQMVINQMLRSCIQEQIMVEELTNEDAFYLLYWLRGNSYSTNYPVEVTCPHMDCRYGPDVYNIDLARDVVVNYLEEGVREPLEVLLPKTGVTVHITCMRRKAEIQAKRRQADMTEWRNYKGDPTDLLKRAYSMTYMKTREGEESESVLDFEKFCLYYMPASDSIVLDKALETFKHGVDLRIHFNCKRCDQVIYTILPGGQEFFRASIPDTQDEGKSL